MSTVAILGAGPLGGALAHKLADRNRVCEVRLIDPIGNIAAGKALDIQQAAPLGRCATRVVAGGIDAVVGTTVVTVTGPADQPADGGSTEAALNLVAQVAQLTRSTPIVCAGASDAALVSSAVCRLGVNRKRILGTAPGALVSGLRALIALEANVSPREVVVNVVGLPPTHTIVAWSSATICGYSLEKSLSTNQLARLRSHVDKLWPPGPYTLASVAARVIEALIVGDSRRAFTCFVAENSREEICAQSISVTLGTNGINAVIRPQLNQGEQIKLETAVGRR